MMKYFVLFASLLVVCFSKRLRLRDPLYNEADIIFTMIKPAGVDVDVFNICITDIPDEATFKGLKNVVQNENALGAFFSKLAKGSDQKWVARVLNHQTHRALTQIQVLGTLKWGKSRGEYNQAFNLSSEYHPACMLQLDDPEEFTRKAKKTFKKFGKEHAADLYKKAQQ
eukprot:Platyproteum_vivax@DN5932_c1_g1_i10.p1